MESLWQDSSHQRDSWVAYMSSKQLALLHQSRPPELILQFPLALLKKRKASFANNGDIHCAVRV